MPSFVRTNHRIRVPQVRCIGPGGEMIGVMPTPQAKKLASDRGMDLVEISPRAEPPVCQIMDYGKFRYDQKQKQKEQKKHQHRAALKEIKFHVNVEQHDYDFKVNHIKEFISKGHKVKLTLFFRGRENAHRDLGFKVMDRVLKDCEDIASIDMAPKLVGRGIFGVLAPKSAKGGTKQGKGSKKAAKKSAPKPAPAADKPAAAAAKPAPAAEKSASVEAKVAPAVKAPAAEAPKKEAE